MAWLIAMMLWIAPPPTTTIARAPNPHLTPGKVRHLNGAEICSTKWGLDRRHVSEKKKREVAARYGIDRARIVGRGKGPCCEFDHLIPRELGGADEIENLWPQPWADATVKDRRENLLHLLFCNGTMTLHDARAQMLAWPGGKG